MVTVITIHIVHSKQHPPAPVEALGDPANLNMMVSTSKRISTPGKILVDINTICKCNKSLSSCPDLQSHPDKIIRKVSKLVPDH